MAPSFRDIRREAARRLLGFEPLFWASLALRTRALRPHERPLRQEANLALKTASEWEQAQREVQRIGLRPHPDGPKNWDSLIALDQILESLPSRSSAVLDAGAAAYSSLPSWLYWYGYRDLHGINLIFDRPFNYGRIRYQPGDITRSPYPDARFDAITCLSVLEHGVDVGAFLREAHRTLRSNGLLIVSCDYHPEPTDTSGLSAYGAPVHVFDRAEAEEIVAVAARTGFEPTSPVVLDCVDRPVRWTRLGIAFTFLLLAFRKLP